MTIHAPTIVGSGPAGYTAGTGCAAAIAAERWLTEQSGITLAAAGEPVTA